MKKLFLLIGVLGLFVQSFAQSLSIGHLDIVKWNTPYFVINYSEVLEQPVNITYRVACIDGTASRKGLDFHKESGIKTSDNEDYKNNVWDKGHMAPAASFNCNPDMLWETFTYMNCALQHEKLNRGIWKTLEERERYVSKWSGEMASVYIEVDFDQSTKRVPGGAAIPMGFYKEILFGDYRECYWFANTEPKSDELDDYKCECRN
jgi:DNA/RNA endonuclease G (NUC1)